MNNDIINLAPVTVTSKTFKSAALNEATAKIASIYANAAKYADAKNREIAAVLAKVAAEKSYEEDGFKSVADYANKSFGIARQNAYALATAGKVYNDESAAPALKAFSPSKLAEIANVPAPVLEKAITSGEISADTTQKELREFAKSSKSAADSGKTEIVDTYVPSPCMTLIPDGLAETCKDNRLLDDWDTFFCDYVALTTGDSADNIEMVKLPKGYVDLDAKKPTINRKLYFNRYMSIVVEFRKYAPPKKSTTVPAPKYTLEELRAMLKAAEAEQNNGEG